jgi:3-methyladenine DNA glycosylase AlkD
MKISHQITGLFCPIFYQKIRKQTEKTASRKDIFDFYLKNARKANNWELVDVTCRDVIGLYLLDKTDRNVLYRLAESDNLWEQRITIVSTWTFIKNRQFDIIQIYESGYSDHLPVFVDFRVK